MQGDQKGGVSWRAVHHVAHVAELVDRGAAEHTERGVRDEKAGLAVPGEAADHEVGMDVRIDLLRRIDAKEFETIVSSRFEAS